MIDFLDYEFFYLFSKKLLGVYYVFSIVLGGKLINLK